jgi:DNA-binding FadR family transcriptional regulator
MKGRSPVPLAAAAPRSLVDQAIDAIRQLLASGEWAVGTRIPPEPALAAELGVGRNTVREAVRALSHAGMLEVRQGDGTYVVSAHEVSGVMRRQIARAELGHVLEVRHAIESSAAALAAQRRTRRDVSALEKALARRTAAVAAADEEAFVDADAAFHLGVVAAARNPLLVELYDGFVATLRANLALPVGGVDDLDADHAELLAAIRDQDVAGAVSATGGLLRHVEQASAH